jgi:CRP-like cAMP-binding protein
MRMRAVPDLTISRPPDRRVALLDVDPDLGAGLSPAERAQATRAVSASLHRLAPGPWIPGPEHRAGSCLVVSGLLTRETALGRAPASELLGPGDVLCIRGRASDILHATTSWTVTVPSRLVVLDGAWAAAARRWPAIEDAVRRRLEDQLDRASIHGAIRQLRRVEDRLMAMLVQLADRWGRVGPEGLIVPLPLTHQALGRLVGAERPTVSLAITQLKEAGLLDRRDDGCWVLRGAHTSAVASRALTAVG